MDKLTEYEMSRLRYLEHYEGPPEHKGGLDGNERSELSHLRKKTKSSRG